MSSNNVSVFTMATNNGSFITSPTQSTTAMINNSTTPEELCIRHPLYQNTMVVLFIITVALSTFENILLWLAFIINKGLRTHANVYVVSLSLSDFTTTASLGWMEIYYIWNYPYWSFGETGTMAQNSFWCLSLISPFVHITAITVDRYRAIASTKSYRRRSSLKREVYIIIGIWVYSLSVTVLMAFHFTPAEGYEYQWNVLPEWYYPLLAIHIVIPMVLCSVLYILILQIATKSRREIESYQEDPKKQEFKLAKTIGVIILLLYAVWLPVIVMEVIYGVLAHTCVIAQVGTISVWLTCTSGVINPIVFMWKNKKFRTTILSRILCCSKPENDAKNTLSTDKSLHSSTSCHYNRSYEADS